MADGDAKDITTNQVRNVPNPTGRGGFGDHPENISPGGWSKENSYSYWQNYFKSLTSREFQVFPTNNPNMTMAAAGAYARVAKSVTDRQEFEGVANRTEGMPKQSHEIEGRILTGLLPMAPQRDGRILDTPPQTTSGLKTPGV